MRKNLLFAVLSLIGMVAFSQGITTSSMNGRITDDNGEPLIGATVMAVHTPSGTQYGAVTNVEGLYRIVNMRVGGPYKVTISYLGFSDYSKPDVYLALGQTFALNINLQEDAQILSDVVVLANRNNVFDGNRTGAESNIDENLVSSLPTAARNISDFTRLTPQARISGDNSISIAGANNRYNTFYIDGANNTDAFGLEGSGTNGGGTGAPPISLDAIEQFNVNIAPYDVTVAGFTGGGINAVTRSGTNDFEGSAYYFTRNENLAGKTPTDDEDEDRERLPEFSARTYGFRLGGPVIKNKLFFFVNAELQRDETPVTNNFNSYLGDVTSAQLNTLRERFTGFGYDPGSFDQQVSDDLTSDRFLAKLDWNINENHQLMLRHSINNIEVIDRNGTSNTAINFSNNGEFTINETSSTALELKSTFGNDFSNSFLVSYTDVLEDRDPINDGRLPAVTIEDGDNSIFIGPDPFSTGNILEQRTITITNNFNWYKGKHLFTIGTHNEFYRFKNLFLGENFGNYTYAGVDDFLGGAAPIGFSRSYSIATPNVLGDDIESGAAIFDAYQLGFYIQDEYQASDRLKLTLGLRADIPGIADDPVAPFDDFNTVTRPAIEAAGYDLAGAEPGAAPDPQLLISPRFGFNYDVNGDQSLQLRGGAGLFTGRILFVWPGGAFTNSGGVIGRVSGDPDADDVRLANGDALPYYTDLNQLPVAGDLQNSSPVSLPTGRLEMFEQDFRYPQVFRANLAIDQKLPWWGLIGTFEGIYTANINNIDLRNVNVSDTTVTFGGAEDRQLFTGSPIDDRFNEILVVGNTNEGHSYNLTAQIQKPFDNGFTGSVAYTFGRSMVINDGTSSQLTSVWRRNEVTDNNLNNIQLTRSDFDPGSRILAYASYRKEYLGKMATTLGLVYTGQSGQPYSYVINQSSGSRNVRNQDVFQNSPHDGDLPYIPRNEAEANLVDLFDREGVLVATAAEQWQQLDAFIEADDYLSGRRGQFAERNMARQPFTNIIDLKFMQEFYINVGDKRNTLQVTVDIFNFTNMLNRDWGRIETVSFNAFSLLDFRGYVDAANGDYTPTYNFTRGDTSPDEIFNIDDSGINSSRWQMQFGLRYIFGG